MSRPHPFEPAPRHELDVHPAVVDYLARVGEALMDSSTLQEANDGPRL